LACVELKNSAITVSTHDVTSQNPFTRNENARRHRLVKTSHNVGLRFQWLSHTNGRTDYGIGTAYRTINTVTQPMPHRYGRSWTHTYPRAMG
jgi:hypothetical protein